MDKLLDSPWFLRFIALFLAILLFFTVQAEQGKLKTNSGGEEQDVLLDVPVDIIYDNENLIVTGVPETVDMAVEGPVSFVQTITMLKDFSLFVDLTSLPMGEHQVQIQHENISDKLKVRIDPSTIKVLIEEKVTKTFKVEPEFNRQHLAENFYVKNMEVDPTTIEVTGAKSVIDSISFVKATVSSEPGVNESFEQEARVRVLDRDLNKLDLLIEPESVKVKVEIEENSKEVPIVLKPKGQPPAGVIINEISSSDKKVILSGPSKVLDDIEAFIVDVDVSKIKKSGPVEAELKVPAGVSKISLTKLKVIVDVSSDNNDEDETAEGVSPPPDSPDNSADEGQVNNTLKFEGVQVVVTGLDQEFKGVLTKPQNGVVTLTVTAPADVIGRLQRSDFNVVVDASDVTDVGEFVYPITVKGPGNVNWTLSNEDATLRIELA